MITESGNKNLALISLLKPYDITFPSASGTMSDMELGGWIHAGYTPEEEAAQTIWSTRIWNLRARNTNWVSIRRTTATIQVVI